MTSTDTTPVTSRFTNSTIGWNCRGATRRSFSQVGQSLQPRPEPVRRTAPPVTTIPMSPTSAARHSQA